MHKPRTILGQVLAGASAAIIGYLIADVLRRQLQPGTPETTPFVSANVIRGRVRYDNFCTIGLQPDEVNHRVLVDLSEAPPELLDRIQTNFTAASGGKFIIGPATDHDNCYEVLYPSYPGIMPDLAFVAIILGTLTDPYCDTSEKLYRLPSQVMVTIATPIGEITFRTAGGYFRGVGIFVYTPDEQPFDPEIIEGFAAETGNQFLIEHAPGSSSGGDSEATHLISAGTDIERYTAYYEDGTTGYFKMSPAPRLPAVVDIVAEQIARFHARTSAATR